MLFVFARTSRHSAPPITIVCSTPYGKYCGSSRGGGRYYLGVTCDPEYRMFGDDVWKHHHKYRYMYIIGLSNALGIIRQEIDILDDNRVGLNAPLCPNRARGGGGVSKQADPWVPYFLYVVV